MASAVVRLSPVSMTTRTPSARSASSAAGVEGLIGIGDGDDAGGLAVDGRRRSRWRRRGACARPSRRARRCRCRARAGNAALPMVTSLPSTRPTAPLPVGESKSVAAAKAMPRCSAAATTAAASGCSLARSTLAARRNSSASSKPAAGVIAVTAGLPSVSVPVLSTTRVSTFSMRSSASAFLISTPASRAAPDADHDRHGRGEPERARAGDDQHGDGGDERVGEARLGPPHRPGDEGQHGDQDDERHEPAGDRVGEALDRRAAALRLGDQLRRCGPAWCRGRRARRR